MTQVFTDTETSASTEWIGTPIVVPDNPVSVNFSYYGDFLELSYQITKDVNYVADLFFDGSATEWIFNNGVGTNLDLGPMVYSDNPFNDNNDGENDPVLPVEMKAFVAKHSVAEHIPVSEIAKMPEYDYTFNSHLMQLNSIDHLDLMI